MPRFYFHLRAPDEFFQDGVGIEVADLAAAHSKAMQLAERVMSYGAFSNLEQHMKHWTVEVVDNNERPIITVIFPNHFDADKRKCGCQVGGAHLLQQYLERQLSCRGNL